MRAHARQGVLWWWQRRLLHSRWAPRRAAFGPSACRCCSLRGLTPVPAALRAAIEDAWHVLSAAPAGLEDGTLAFLSIIALKHGFNLLRSLGGMKVHTRMHVTLRQSSRMLQGSAWQCYGCIGSSCDRACM